MYQMGLLDPPLPGYCWWLDLAVVSDWLFRHRGEYLDPRKFVNRFSVDALTDMGAFKQVPYVIEEDPV
jgi:hypothetical protein